jgi:hypothetical protein
MPPQERRPAALEDAQRRRHEREGRVRHHAAGDRTPARRHGAEFVGFRIPAFAAGAPPRGFRNALFEDVQEVVRPINVSLVDLTDQQHPLFLFLRGGERRAERTEI